MDSFIDPARHGREGVRIMRNTSFGRCLLAVCAAASCLTAAASASSPSDDADQIIKETIARAKQADEVIQERWGDLRFRIRSTTETLNADGEVAERHETLSEVYPIHGISYSRLVEIDGRPLTKTEMEKEDERERQFRLEAEKHEETGRKSTDDESVRIDENLAAKYRFHHDGEEELGGEPAYVISFEPRSGKLPAKNRIETVLNKTAGRIWIDRGTLEIRKIEFSLREKVEFLLGLVGTLSDLKGVFEREPLNDEGLWVPRRLQFYTNGRLLFDSLHRNQLMQWSDYQVVSGEIAPGRR
jgi:hypothetical protein